MWHSGQPIEQQQHKKKNSCKKSCWEVSTRKEWLVHPAPSNKKKYVIQKIWHLNVMAFETISISAKKTPEVSSSGVMGTPKHKAPPPPSLSNKETWQWRILIPIQQDGNKTPSDFRGSKCWKWSKKGPEKGCPTDVLGQKSDFCMFCSVSLQFRFFLVPGQLTQQTFPPAQTFQPLRWFFFWKKIGKAHLLSTPSVFIWQTKSVDRRQKLGGGSRNPCPQAATGMLLTSGHWDVADDPWGSGESLKNWGLAGKSFPRALSWSPPATPGGKSISTEKAK